ncbi:MAG: tryptophan-rich sensory protein [Acidimicrobiia bacterium]|nr:tryptophan-rich sensory protein [Acidimicrobiia bacterium]MDH4365404.1 tryptophan-rich sensory protein [Acidimicrobiia bacterium]MDH5289592.1 tryptophan-rich sensory protein [Acidimicrobiia bacterium]
MTGSDYGHAGPGTGTNRDEHQGRRPTWALGEIGGLWVAVALTAARFWSVDKRAGGLFVPYLAWVSFAAALNAEIVRLNRAK